MRKEEAEREAKGFTNKNFWSQSYCVSAVGLDEN
ncbi:MAG: hypothetical protein LBG43_05140 [Treponema sp.]|nr:hypothetical protein [Treponema sp.]